MTFLLNDSTESMSGSGSSSPSSVDAGSTGLFSSTRSGTKALLFSQAVLFGTGSAFATEQVDRWRDYVQVRYPVQIEEALEASEVDDPGRPDLRSAEEHLAHIRDVLRLSVSELSRMAGVSRQMMYRWMSGKSTPGEDRAERLARISAMADRFATEGVFNPAALLRMRAFDGESLIDRIAEDRDVDRDVDLLLSETRRQQVAYERMGPARSPASDDWQADISIPGSLESEQGD